MRNTGHYPQASATAPPQARHLCIETGFINEDNVADTLWVSQKPGLALAPHGPSLLHIAAFLFTGVFGFFLKLILQARSQSSMVDVGAFT
jgi:hypothetical protein